MRNGVGDLETFIRRCALLYSDGDKFCSTLPVTHNGLGKLFANSGNSRSDPLILIATGYPRQLALAGRNQQTGIIG
jgi:hypothetical protein